MCICDNLPARLQDRRGRPLSSGIVSHEERCGGGGSGSPAAVRQINSQLLWESTMNRCISNRARVAAIAKGRITSVRYWRRVGAGLILTMIGAAGARAQSGAHCPLKAALTLPSVVADIEKKTDDGVLVSLIKSCQVNFPMDAQALDRLSNAGASKNVLDALNEVTASQLALEQARSEVAELDHHLEETGKAVNAERDGALRQLDAEYLPQREQASHIDPKGEFESTADFNVRKQQNQNALAAMDQKHEADRSQLAAAYAKKADDKEQPYRARIAFLEANTYPDFRAILYSSYNPDTRQLKATLDGDEYWFDNVPSQTAETLVKNWPKVRVTQLFSDGGFHSRYLVLASLSASVPGYSSKAKRQAEIEMHLAQARARMSSHDYHGAISEFQSVLASEPNDQAAKDGIAVAQGIQQKHDAFLKGLYGAGIWLDPQTHLSSQTRLMWTMQDSEHTVNWQGASDYCQALRIGGFSNWGLSSPEELKGIYDPAITKLTKRNRLGASFYYRIKGPIELRGIFLWTAAKQNDRTGIWFSPSDGTLNTDGLNSKMDYHALCVRAYEPYSDGLDLPQSPGALPGAPQR